MGINAIERASGTAINVNLILFMLILRLIFVYLGSKSLY
jgi:hypothetical protein